MCIGGLYSKFIKHLSVRCDEQILTTYKKIGEIYIKVRGTWEYKGVLILVEVFGFLQFAFDLRVKFFVMYTRPPGPLPTVPRPFKLLHLTPIQACHVMVSEAFT